MLLDTSGLLAQLFSSEPQHSLALILFESTPRKLTHSYVLSELVSLAQARKYPRVSVLGFVHDLLLHPQVEVVWVEEVLTREALSLLEQRQDKGYSLCDAVSFFLMRRFGFTEAITTDHHFEQEGFHRLLIP